MLLLEFIQLWKSKGEAYVELWTSYGDGDNCDKAGSYDVKISEAIFLPSVSTTYLKYPTFVF